VSEALYVDGINMKTLARNVDSLAAVLRAPGKRTSNTLVSGRHGSMFASKQYDQNTIVWNLWVRGVNEDGTIPTEPGGQRQKFLKAVDTLNGLFGVAHRDLVIRYHRYDGTIREARGSVQNVIDWSTNGQNPLGRLSIEIQLHDPFWRETEYQSFTLFPNTDNGGYQNIYNMVTPAPGYEFGQRYAAGTPLTGKLGNAPIVDPIIDIIGPFSQAVISLGTDQGTFWQNTLVLSLDGTPSDTTITRVFTGIWEARWLDKTTVATAPNLIYDPSFEYRASSSTTGGTTLPTLSMLVNGTDWATSGVSSGTIQIHNSSSAGFSSPRVGSNWFARTNATSSGALGIKTGFFLGGSQPFRVKGHVRMGVNSRTVNMVIKYFTSVGGSQVGSTVTVGQGVVSTSAWTNVNSGSLTTPATTTYVEVTFEAQSAVSGDLIYVDDIHARNSSSDLAYMDGDTSINSGWSGYPGGSPSKEITYTTDSMTPSFGIPFTQVGSSSIHHYGSASWFTIPPDNRYVKATVALGQFGLGLGIDAYGPPVPTQISIAMQGAHATKSAIRIWYRKAWLSA